MSDRGAKPSMQRSAFITQLAGLGRALRPRRDLRAIVGFGRRVLEEEQRPLQRFLDVFVAQPDRYRAYWLGRAALARARLTATQRRALDILGSDPDLLGPSQERYDELAHTRTIAWALQRPELAECTREALLRAIASRGRPRHGAALFDAAELDWQSFVARSEVVLEGYGRVDVWLESPSVVLVIEAKLHAGEGADQTRRYHQAAREFAAGRRWVVVFLTLDASQAPEGPALQIDFQDLLGAWLPVAASGRSDTHAHLARYLASVGRVTGVGQTGTFDDWTFSRRRRAIALVAGRDLDE